MKKLLSILVIAGLSSTMSLGQRFVYVDTEYILDNIPEYKEAQEELDVIAEEWKKEVEKMIKKVDKLYRDYQNEQVLLTEDMKRQRMDEIENKEKAIKQYQKEKFGYEGELFKKRQELTAPIQDKVYEAIQKLAKEKGYSFVFDKSSGMLYKDPKYDKSDEILKTLGLKPGESGR